jgi:K+:H+ antiporter subunit KhtU
VSAPLAEVGLFAFAVAVSLLLARRAPVAVIPGLLLGGLFLGPHMTGVMDDTSFLNAANDLGMVLLLFFTALFTHPNALRNGGRIALPLAAYDLVLNFAVAYWIGDLFGWDLQSRLILAGVITTSSTGAILKILSDEGRLLRREGNVLVAMLWFEDIAFIGFFIFVSGRESLATQFGPQLILGVVLFAAFLVLLRLGRELVWRIPQREVLIAVVTGVGVLGAFLGGLAGLPMGGAAFTTGLAVSGSRGARFIQTEAPYLREVSSAAFFFAFGALIDPGVARQVVPLAVAAIGGIVFTELIFLPLVARLLGLSATESLVLGSSLLARGGKSASFARLGAATPAGPQILSVSGLLTLALTPITPLLVRLMLWFRREEDPRVLGRADVLSQITRRVLAPGAYAQRNLVTVWDRIALSGWFLLPMSLGVLGSLLPFPLRWGPIVIGACLLPFAFRGIQDYFRRAPGTPGMTYRYRRRLLPRVDAYLPQLLIAPCLLALVLPLVAPAASLAYPLGALGALAYVLLLPRLVQPGRSAPYGTVLVQRATPAPREL